MRENRKQRIVEFRWQQAREAKELLDNLQSNLGAQNAMRMLDWNGGSYELPDGTQERITYKDVLSALRIENLQFSPKEAFIRDSFDQFFDLLERTEHFLNITLISKSDVLPPIGYYIDIMSKTKWFLKRS